MTRYCKINKICYIGAGFVGGPMAIVLAKMCPSIQHIVVDVDSERISQWNKAQFPVHEEGLDEIFKEVHEKNLFFSTNCSYEISTSDAIVICVNTPLNEEISTSDQEYAIDMTYLESALCSIVQDFKKGRKIIVEKSTVPIGYSKRIQKFLQSHLTEENEFEIISNPEFLCEGTVVHNLLYPDRIVLGCNDSCTAQKACEDIADLYKTWVPDEKICRVSSDSAELSKLASNILLAQRVSSINAIAMICESLGGDIGEVVKILGMDPRIGSQYISPSLGFGGSCLPKDLSCVISMCGNNGMIEIAKYWNSALIINDLRKETFGWQILNAFRNEEISERSVAIFGYTFKKNTNDIRESASQSLARYLLQHGFKVNIHDPIASKSHIEKSLTMTDNDVTMSKIGKNYKVFDDPYEATKMTSAVALCTDWECYRDLDFSRIYVQMEKPSFIFDGRRLLDANRIREIGFSVFTIGSDWRSLSQ